MGFHAISLAPASSDQFVPGAHVLLVLREGTARHTAVRSVTIIYVINIIQIILQLEDKRRWASY